MRKIQSIKLRGLLAFGLMAVVGQSYAQVMNQDSTNLVPNSVMFQGMSKAATWTAGTVVASPVANAVCGSSAGSILPSAPTTFLCASGTAGAVSTGTDSDGDVVYTWTCTSTNGSTSSCMAMQREVGACGTANGLTFTGDPPATALCASGSATGYALNNSTYTWGCTGNYGTAAQCSATLQPASYLSSGSIAATSGTLSATGTNQAEVIFSNDGTTSKYVKYPTTKTVAGANWYTPTTAGIGSNYYFKTTSTTSVGTIANDNVPWTKMTTQIGIVATCVFKASKEMDSYATGNFYVSTAGTDATIVATWTWSVSASCSP